MYYIIRFDHLFTEDDLSSHFCLPRCILLQKKLAEKYQFSVFIIKTNKSTFQLCFKMQIRLKIRIFIHSKTDKIISYTFFEVVET